MYALVEDSLYGYSPVLLHVTLWTVYLVLPLVPFVGQLSHQSRCSVKKMLLDRILRWHIFISMVISTDLESL